MQGEATACHLRAFFLSCAVFAVDCTAQDERTADELNERQAFAQEEHGEYDCRYRFDISADGYGADGEFLHGGEIEVATKACIDDAEHGYGEIVVGQDGRERTLFEEDECGDDDACAEEREERTR